MEFKRPRTAVVAAYHATSASLLHEDFLDLPPAPADPLDPTALDT